MMICRDEEFVLSLLSLTKQGSEVEIAHALHVC